MFSTGLESQSVRYHGIDLIYVLLSYSLLVLTRVSGALLSCSIKLALMVHIVDECVLAANYSPLQNSF